MLVTWVINYLVHSTCNPHGSIIIVDLPSVRKWFHHSQLFPPYRRDVGWSHLLLQQAIPVNRSEIQVSLYSSRICQSLLGIVFQKNSWKVWRL